MANKKLLIEAAERFVFKCENGQAKSSESYKMFKEALATNETENSTLREQVRVLTEGLEKIAMFRLTDKYGYEINREAIAKATLALVHSMKEEGK